MAYINWFSIFAITQANSTKEWHPYRLLTFRNFVWISEFLIKNNIYRKNVLKLIANEKVAGILVYPSTQNKGSDFQWSPASACPKDRPGFKILKIVLWT